jgi:hypothetical protein
MNELADFVLARLADDERRFEAGVLPHLDEAERHGRIRIMRSDDGVGLLLAADPVQAREERVPVPFQEKVGYLRREAEGQADKDMLGLVASVYDTHPDWREQWRP